MAAECTIDTCGIQAVGRCATCREAFCMSHQAMLSNGVQLTDRCSPCQQSIITAERNHHLDYGPDFVRSGRARDLLRRANVPTVEVREVDISYRSKLFGRMQEIESVTLYGRGWLVGSHNWKWNEGGPSTGIDREGTALTVLLDAPSQRSVEGGYLIRVVKDSRRNVLSVQTSSLETFSPVSQRGWAAVAEKVRELAGSRAATS